MLKLKKEKKQEFKINGKIKDPLWKKLECTCSTDVNDVLHKHPIQKCNHCYCEIADASVPTEPFIVNRPITDKDGKWKEDNFEKVTEITLTNCETFQNCLGWSF